MIDPHVLQWTIVGIGGYVVVNFLQSLRLTDPDTHRVIAGSPALLLCLLTGSLQTTINYGVMGFTPAFLMKQFHLGAAEVGVHADFAKQVVHPRGSGAKGHPVSSFSGPAVKGRNPKW